MQQYMPLYKLSYYQDHLALHQLLQIYLLKDFPNIYIQFLFLFLP